MKIFIHRLSISPLLLVLTLLFLTHITGCAPGTTRPSDETGLLVPTDATGKPLSPKERLREFDSQAAKAESPSERAYYQLLAMELLIEYGKTDDVRNRMEKINLRALDRNEQYRIDLLIAQLALASDKAPQALQKLPKFSIDYPTHIQAALLRTRAIALAKLGYLQDSLSVRLELDKVLSQMLPEKMDAQRANHRVIWSILQTMPDDGLASLPREDKILNGWVELALNVRAASDSGLSRDLAVTNWVNRFPKHPAVETLAKTLRSQRDLISTYPSKIALLLPLTGRYSAQAKSIRDGFLASYFTHDSANRPSIRVYDTGDGAAQIKQHYRTAIDEGASLVVGPLHKDAVSALVAEKNLPVPVLALNYANDEESYSSQVIQFGLIPEDEARQAAELAIIKNQVHAIVFTPNNSYGQRLADAFAERYKELGGKLLAIEKYSPDTDHHGQPIQRALNILQSNSRNSILSTVLKTGLKFEPRRREDVEAIFLVANPQQARNFRSQLKFYNSGDVSVYATSQSYTGIVDVKSDRDSDGIVFTDMPWTLQGETNTHFKKIEKYWPKALQRYTRLYALGLDAYRIIPHLARLHANPYERFPGLTGGIALDEHNHIHRELLWATFNQGRVEVLEFASVEDHNLFDPEDDVSYLRSP